MSDALKLRKSSSSTREDSDGSAPESVAEGSRIQFDFVSYHSFCETYGVTLRTLVNEYTFGQLVLLSCASHLLAPDPPEAVDDPSAASPEVPSYKPSPKFKSMSSAAEAMSASGFQGKASDF